MENKLVTVFLAENMRELFIDFANKKITDQDEFDFYWNKIFVKAIEIEKEQMEKFYNEGQDFSTYTTDEIYGGAEYWEREPMSFEKYYNETYIK